jgi:hypothetical protein
MVPHSMPLTTIQLDAKTRRALAGLKTHSRESYDTLLNRLMRLVPEGDDEGRYSPKFRALLLESMLADDEDTIPHELAMKLAGRRP